MRLALQRLKVAELVFRPVQPFNCCHPEQDFSPTRDLRFPAVLKGRSFSCAGFGFDFVTRARSERSRGICGSLFYMATITNPAFTRIAVELQPPAARVTLNNPPLNVIDIPMMEELRAALEQIEARPEISAIVFAGSERAFSSGVDIAAHTPDKVREMLALSTASSAPWSTAKS